MAGGNVGKALGVSMSEPTLDSLEVTGEVELGDAVSVVDLTVSGDASIGADASAALSFWGVTATVQSTAITTFVSGTAATTATYGTPTPDIAALGVAVNSVIAVLRSKGFIAT